LRKWLAVEQSTMNGGELDAHSNCSPSRSQFPGNEKLVIAKAAIGSLDVMLGWAEFSFGIRIDAGIGSGQVPDAGFAPFGRFGRSIGHEYFGPLIWELVIELAPEQQP